MNRPDRLTSILTDIDSTQDIWFSNKDTLITIKDSLFMSKQSNVNERLPNYCYTILDEE